MVKKKKNLPIAREQTLNRVKVLDHKATGNVTPLEDN